MGGGEEKKEKIRMKKASDSVKMPSDSETA